MAGNLREGLSQRIDEVLATRLGRRSVLKGGMLASTAALLAACGAQVGPVTLPGGTDTPKPTEKVPPGAASQAAATEAPTPKPTATAAATATETPKPTATAAATASPEGSAAAAGKDGTIVPEGKPLPEKFRLPKENSLGWQTNSRIGPEDNPIVQQVDIGTLGPDDDVIAGYDFKGDLDTDATVISRPGTGKVLETRVVFIKRTDLDYVQLRDVLGGDQFHEWKTRSVAGGDEGLDARARYHAENSGHTHQKVVYLGDLGAFQKQWGDKPKERAFLQRIIRAQRWQDGSTRLGIPESNFVIKPRRF